MNAPYRIFVGLRGAAAHRQDMRDTTYVLESADGWQPPADRPEGYRCLALHKGDWAFAIWRGERWWVGGYPFSATVFAPLPPLPQGESS